MQKPNRMTASHCSTLPPVSQPPSLCGDIGLTVEAIISLEGFRNLRPVWNNLLQRSHSDCVFLTWEWLFTWWKCYAGNGELLILVVRGANGCERAIAPLMRRRTLGLFRTIQFIGSDSSVCSDFLDVIAEKGSEELVAHALVQYLLQEHREWELFDLSDVPEDSLFLQALRQVPAFRRLPIWQTVKHLAPSLSYPDSWRDLLAQFGRSTRKKIRQYRKRLRSKFRTQFLAWHELFDCEQTMAVMAKLQKASISRKGHEGVFNEEKYRVFHSQIVKRFHQKGWLYIVFLTCDGKPAAFQYNYLYAHRCYGYQMGFDPEYASFRVGTVLQSFVFEDSLTKGAHSYEHLRGDEAYKHHYATSIRRTIKLSIFNNTKRSAMFRLALWLRDNIKATIKTLLPSMQRRRWP
jgi:CelD/BcsL family acetyltransferase involved in cellulose biosynthesis